MPKTFTLHLDALVAIGLVFAAAVAFIAWQRYEYVRVKDDNLERQVQQLKLELQLARAEALLRRCGIKEP